MEREKAQALFDELSKTKASLVTLSAAGDNFYISVSGPDAIDGSSLIKLLGTFESNGLKTSVFGSDGFFTVLVK